MQYAGFARNELDRAIYALREDGKAYEIVIFHEKGEIVKRGARIRQALERLRERNWRLPPGWKFDREEIYEERLGKPLQK